MHIFLFWASMQMTCHRKRAKKKSGYVAYFFGANHSCKYIWGIPGRSLVRFMDPPPPPGRCGRGGRGHINMLSLFLGSLHHSVNCTGCCYGQIWNFCKIFLLRSMPTFFYGRFCVYNFLTLCKDEGNPRERGGVVKMTSKTVATTCYLKLKGLRHPFA